MWTTRTPRSSLISSETSWLTLKRRGKKRKTSTKTSKLSVSVATRPMPLSALLRRRLAAPLGYKISREAMMMKKTKRTLQKTKRLQMTKRHLMKKRLLMTKRLQRSRSLRRDRTRRNLKSLKKLLRRIHQSPPCPAFFQLRFSAMRPMKVMSRQRPRRARKVRVNKVRARKATQAKRVKRVKTLQKKMRKKTRMTKSSLHPTCLTLPTLLLPLLISASLIETLREAPKVMELLMVMENLLQSKMNFLSLLFQRSISP